MLCLVLSSTMASAMIPLRKVHKILMVLTGGIIGELQ